MKKKKGNQGKCLKANLEGVVSYQRYVSDYWQPTESTTNINKISLYTSLYTAFTSPCTLIALNIQQTVQGQDCISKEHAIHLFKKKHTMHICLLDTSLSNLKI